MTIRLVPAEDLQLEPRIGVSKLAKLAFDGADMNALWAELVPKLKSDPEDVETAMDLSVVAQLAGQRQLGLDIQDQALAVRRLFRSPCASGRPRLRLLAFAAASDIGGNTPLEFLLEGSDVELYTLYIVPGMELPEALPDHDAAFVAVPACDATHTALIEIERLARDWPRPILNNPRKILELERDRLHKLLGGIPGLDVPAAARADRDDLSDVAEGITPPGDLLADAKFPLIVRPLGSQAGRGLENLDNAEAILPYLAPMPDEDFLISRFADYGSADGLFRKYRIVFVDGKPYACHMAVSTRWNFNALDATADMLARNRAEEARFMAAFDEDFALRHSSVLGEIARRAGLDYFAIDCAEAKSGALLIFEADIAMIVHDMEPAETCPYKSPQMRKIFAAFAAMLEVRSKAGRQACAEAA